MDKQEVFSIMGSHYGNAYFRDATLTPEDARRVMSKGVEWVVFGQDSIVLGKALKANLDALEDF